MYDFELLIGLKPIIIKSICDILIQVLLQDGTDIAEIIDALLHLIN